MSDSAVPPVPELRGPVGYRNWRAYLEGAEELEATESLLYTDAQVECRQREELGPYSLLYTGIVIDDQSVRLRMRETAQPSFVLRAGFHMPRATPPTDAPDDHTWHAGGVDDELAALLSLALGIRLRAGGLTRTFAPDGDPRGVPVEWAHAAPQLHGKHGRYVPTADGIRLADATTLLGRYPLLKAADAMSLLRALAAIRWDCGIRSRILSTAG